MALRGHRGTAILCDVFYAMFFYSMGYCEDLVMRGSQPENLTLIVIHSKTSRKKEVSILVKGWAVTGGWWPFVAMWLLTPLLLSIEVSSQPLARTLAS